MKTQAINTNAGDSNFPDEIMKRLDAIDEKISALQKLIAEGSYEWLDNHALMDKFHISRRTALNWRDRGLPFTDDGKIMYRLDLVDKFLNDKLITLKKVNDSAPTGAEATEK